MELINIKNYKGAGSAGAREERGARAEQEERGARAVQEEWGARAEQEEWGARAVQEVREPGKNGKPGRSRN